MTFAPVGGSRARGGEKSGFWYSGTGGAVSRPSCPVKAARGEIGMIGAFIVCEECGLADFYPLWNKNSIIRHARYKGWSIGKRQLCPVCRKNKKKDSGRLIIKAELSPPPKEE